LVDDDGDLLTHIAGYLATHGFSVACARNAVELGRVLLEGPVDLIILDVMLPGEDGLSICRRLTTTAAPPIIMLSAMGEEVDRITGLELGADDYLTKPCSPRELLAHVRAVLRRRRMADHLPAQGKPISQITFDGFTLNLVRRQLYAPNGSVIVLSSNEFSLLAAFLEKPGAVLSREELARFAGIGSEAGVDRAVDMQVSRLRRKIHAEAQSEVIVTVRGRGYRLADQASDDRGPDSAGGKNHAASTTPRS
jgi:two-component system OmpR family response regulator